MIEVLFGESEAASMKAAKSTVIYSKTNGPISVFAVGKKVKPVQEEICGRWGEVAAEEFSYFLKYQVELSEHERRMYAGKWLELVEENSKLGVVVNNQLISAPETFYDYIIWNSLGNKTIKEARLIGNMLGNFRIGIGDWWYAKRIQYFIEQEMIEVIEDSEKKYARTIRSCR